MTGANRYISAHLLRRHFREVQFCESCYHPIPALQKICKRIESNQQAYPWEWDSNENTMGNVPGAGMGWNSMHCISHGTYGTVAM